MTTTSETCPLCGGTGWKTIAHGKEREVVRCDCRVRDRAERLLAAAHIPARYEHCELSNFECDPDRANETSLGHAKWLAGRFVEEYPAEKKGLLLVGSAGVGKTHLAIGMIKEIIREKSRPALFCDYRELLKSIQDSYNPSVQTTEMELLRPVLDVEVLLIDDLAAVRSSEWIFDIVNYILNSRYNREGTTIITTNFPDKPEKASIGFDNLTSKAVVERVAREDTLGDRIGHRMWSRLHEMCRKVEVQGPDFRQMAKKAQFQKKEGRPRFSVAAKRRLGQAQQGQATLSDQLECGILALTAMIAGNRRGNQLAGWSSLLEKRVSQVPDNQDLIAAFERLHGRGIVRLSDMEGKEYSAMHRNHFFDHLFAVEITAEGLSYWESIKAEANG